MSALCMPHIKPQGQGKADPVNMVRVCPHDRPDGCGSRDSGTNHCRGVNELLIVRLGLWGKICGVCVQGPAATVYGEDERGDDEYMP